MRKKLERGGPSFGIVDSQSVKTQSWGEHRGFDGGKKIKGRKRHIVVDTQGRLLAVHVHSAQLHDATGSETVLARAAHKHPSLRAFNGDEAYRAKASRFVENKLGLVMYITARMQHQFKVLPQRWVVERTSAWLSKLPPSRKGL